MTDRITIKPLHDQEVVIVYKQSDIAIYELRTTKKKIIMEVAKR